MLTKGQTVKPWHWVGLTWLSGLKQSILGGIEDFLMGKGLMSGDVER